MLDSWEFRLSTRIRFGWGLTSKLAQILADWGRKVFWVGYRSPGQLETAYEKLRRQLHTAELVVEEFFEVGGEPNVQLVNRGAEAARAFGAEVVLGVGGGSVLDTAKAIAGLVRMGGPLEQYLPIPPVSLSTNSGASLPGTPNACDLPELAAVPSTDSRFSSRTSTSRIEQALPVVAVPTTAGTGSEVTSLAVFGWEDPAGREMPRKLTLAAEALAPKVALVDPELTLSCPPDLTARCGADALAHAIEATLSRATSPLVHLLAEEAIIRILTSLPVALSCPQDRRAREALALAATLAGIVLQQAGATLAHGMAHALGALAGVPHGVAVAICMPIALQYNWPEASALLACWARRLGLPGLQEQDLAHAFLAHIQDLFQKAGLPSRPKLPEAVQQDWPSLLAQNAFQTTATALKLNPRKIDPPTLADLFRKNL